MSNADRVQLAQVLHDGIAQDLVALGYGLDQMLAAPDSSIQQRVDLRTLRLGVDELIEKVRAQLFELRATDTISMREAISQSVIDLGITDDVRIDIGEIPLETQSQRIIFEIALELLRNAKNHSRATRIELSISQYENHMCLRVFDNGLGGAAVKPGRFGLMGIKEKISSLQGEFKLESNERGTTAVIVI